MPIYYLDSGSIDNLEVSSSLLVSGTLTVSGSILISEGGLTGSLLGTASWANNSVTASYVTGSVFSSTNPALSASFAVSASWAPVGQSTPAFPFTGSAQITGSLTVTGSVSVTGSLDVNNTLYVSSSSVGIGTSSPSEKLDLGTTGWIKVPSGWSENGGLYFTYSSADANSRSWAILNDQSYGNLNILSSATQTGNAKLGNLRLAIKSNGDTGIGGIAISQDPNHTYLTVSGKTTTKGGAIYLRTLDGSYAFQILVDSTRNLIDGTNDLPIVFSTNGTVKTTLFSNGNFLIQSGGTHTDQGFKLDVSGSTRITNGLIVTGSSTINNLTGSLFGTASFANTSSFSITASFALNAGGGSGTGFPFAGLAVITGSVVVSSGSGIFAPALTASEALTAGDFINIASGGVRRATNNDTNKQAHGFVTQSVSANASVFVFYGGLNTNVTGLTAGSRYFLGTTGGETLTPPTTAGQLSQEIGVAISSTAILVNFGPAIVT